MTPQAEGSSDEEEVQGSPKGLKRARANTLGESRVTSNGQSRGEARAQLALLLPRHSDGYVPGSVVRIRLHNFVTYDDVEFFPGPRLNMIIGPNGTGKSSIACAIALGLNWAPSILGRANELNLFVKNTREEGWIEIELKGNIERPNVVIKRTLSSKSKVSIFYVNNRPSTGREVTQTMSELNIQVGNLCSFLPQDRVSEFAQMSPQQLLRETQRAAGDEHLLAWHDTLVNAGKERKDLMDLLKSDRKQLETLRERNENLKREVQRFRERKEIEKKIAVLEMVILFTEYYEMRERYREAKIKQRDLHAKVVMIKRKALPLHEFQKHLETQICQLSDAREQKKRVVRRHLSELHKKSEENDNLTSTTEDIHTQLESVQKSEQTRLKRIKDLEKSTGELRGQLDKPAQPVNLEGITEETRALNMMSAALSQKRLDLSDRQARNVDLSSRWKAEIREGSRGIQQLDNVAHQKLEALKRAEPDIYATVLWLRQNQSLFHEKILEPPIVTLTVSNRAYLDAIEACFAAHLLRSFIAQNDSDYRLFNRLVVDTTEAIGRQGRISTSLNKVSNGHAPPPTTNEQIRELGFDGWALDFVSCPLELHTFLRQSVHLHRTAVGISNPLKISPDKAVEMAASGRGASYVIGRTMNTVMKSQYGLRLAQNATREIRQARFLGGPTVNLQHKISLERTINEAQEQLIVTEAEAEELAAEDRALREQEKDHKKAHSDLTERKNKMTEARNHRARIQNRLSTEETRLNDLKSQLPLDAERERLRASLARVSGKQVVLAEKFLEITRKLRRGQIEQTAISLRVIQLGSTLTALGALIQERTVSYQETLDLYQTAFQIYNDLKDECYARNRDSEAQLGAADPEVQEEVIQMNLEGCWNQRSLGETKDSLAEQQQRLELVMEANPGAVEQYERRKAEIETLAKKVEEREAEIEKRNQTIRNTHDRWLPALQELVTSIGDKFTVAFNRIGCAGQIELTEQEEYDNWAITIWVKFRDDAQLQKLTSHRQSGGERSLTTIMYLMSMTEQARSPFSLVDEINQGMDQRAERVIHNQLVQTTCETECGQYFLITPKLLPDLFYHAHMKILCVNNGEWLPADKDLGGSMTSMLRAYLRHPSRQVSSTNTCPVR